MGGEGDPHENKKNIEFLSNIGPDFLRATKPAFNIEPSSARQRNAILNIHGVYVYTLSQ